jgi:hypothetical protein
MVPNIASLLSADPLAISTHDDLPQPRCRLLHRAVDSLHGDLADLHHTVASGDQLGLHRTVPCLHGDLAALNHTVASLHGDLAGLHRTVEWVDALPSPHTANKPSHTCNFIHPVERERHGN